VAPLASELARKLEETIRQQANIPTPTPTATAARAPASPPAGGGAPASGGSGGAPVSGSGSPAGSSATRDSIPAGPAIILRETVLRHEPRDGATALATLAPETIVSVRGPVSGLWVSVEAEASILPGWVRWSDLLRVDEDAAPAEGEAAPIGSAGITPSPTSQQPGAATAPTASDPITAPTSASGPGTSPARVVVTALDPALPPPAPAPIARVPFVLAVAVVASDRPASGGSVPGFASPTPDLRQPIARVRVQLLNVFGDLLAEGLTDSQGAVSLSRDIWPGQALRVRMPAWGVELPLATGQSSLIVTIPEERP
ncbi:MAG TPA: hypothetical protein PKD53_28635, partial [Chloroflexaceae bacterium]|nr:hypothetical protein [Chloroflexaceae bacterium]